MNKKGLTHIFKILMSFIGTKIIQIRHGIQTWLHLILCAFSLTFLLPIIPNTY